MDLNEPKILKQFMVEFNLPSPFPEDLNSYIPQQQEEVKALFTNGKLMSYSLALDRSKLWVVFLASSESELLLLIDQLPLSKYFDYDYAELMFHQSLRLLPAMSLN